MGPPSGLCLSPVLSDLPGPVQVPAQSGHSSNADSSSMASEGVISGSSASVGGSFYRPSFTSQSTQTAQCPSSAPVSRHATSRMETVERFARHLSLYRRVTVSSPCVAGLPRVSCTSIVRCTVAGVQIEAILFLRRPSRRSPIFYCS